MPTPKAIQPPRREGLLAPTRTRNLRPVLDALPPEGRRLARTAGAALAVAALLTAFAASAQTAAYGGPVEGGVLAWVFALFIAAAVLGVFLVVLTLGARPAKREAHELPGTARNR